MTDPIDTDWDFVEPSEQEVAMILDQRKEGDPADITVAVRTHVALDRVDNEGSVSVRWLLTARIVLKSPACANVTAADFIARVPCSGGMTVADAKEKWNGILVEYLTNEWLPIYASAGCAE